MTSPACTFYRTQKITRELFDFEPDQPAAAPIGDCIDSSDRQGFKPGNSANPYGRPRRYRAKINKSGWLPGFE